MLVAVDFSCNSGSGIALEEIWVQVIGAIVEYRYKYAVRCLIMLLAAVCFLTISGELLHLCLETGHSAL